MIRGVNKKIIEVLDTQSEYFERAILFLKENRPEGGEDEIKKNADTFLQTAGTHRLRRSKRGKAFLEVGKFLLASAFGFGLALFLFVI